MSTLLISGCGLGDVVFTLDKAVFGTEIVWNVTRMQRDADAGAFGRPVTVLMSALPPMSELHNSNVDWDKVAGMLTVHCNEPDKSILLKPALQVMVVIGDTLYRLPVDGNHRICARRVIGYLDFECHVVPLEVEQRYRVTERVIS